MGGAAVIEVLGPAVDGPAPPSAACSPVVDSTVALRWIVIAACSCGRFGFEPAHELEADAGAPAVEGPG
ncbi:hypothetical protein BH11MYX1_BH11MYX1_43150 [soil metagenome]